MRTEVRTYNSNIAIIGLVGRLTAGNGIACLRDQVIDLLRCNFTNIVLNLERVDLVDCAGIGQMVNCACRARGRGGRLKLVNVHRRLGELLTLFRLESVLEKYVSEEAAIGSFAASHSAAPIAEQPVRTSRERMCLGWCQL